MGEISARNMLSSLKLLIKLLFLHLVGCLYYCISDARSHKHQSTAECGVPDFYCKAPYGEAMTRYRVQAPQEK